MNWKITTIATYENVENGYSVVFEEIGEAKFFGPSHVRVTLNDENGLRIDYVETTILNDGARLYEDHAFVLWKNDKVEITLDGSEQEPQIIEF